MPVTGESSRARSPSVDGSESSNSAKTPLRRYLRGACPTFAAALTCVGVSVTSCDGGAVPFGVGGLLWAAALVWLIGRWVHRPRQPLRLLGVIALLAGGWLAFHAGRILYRWDLVTHLDEFQPIADRLTLRASTEADGEVVEFRPHPRIFSARAIRDGDGGSVVTMVVASRATHGTAGRRSIVHCADPSRTLGCQKRLNANWYDATDCR